MNENEIKDTIKKRVQNPELLKALLYRTDSYGDTILEKTIKKFAYAEEIAESFGFDSVVPATIVIIDDLSTPCFGEIGDRFLREIDPEYTRSGYRNLLARKLLNGLESPTTDAIFAGVQNVSKGIHQTPEEQIALMMKTGFAFADSLEKRDLASLFVSRYRVSIIEKTAKTGVLTEPTILENTLDKREKCEISPEEQENRMKTLRNAHQYFLRNMNKIPQKFKEGWGDVSDEVLAAYYIVGTDDKFLSKFAKDDKNVDDSKSINDEKDVEI